MKKIKTGDWRRGYTEIAPGIKTFNDDDANIHTLFLSKDFDFDIETAKKLCREYFNVRVCNF